MRKVWLAQGLQSSPNSPPQVSFKKQRCAPPPQGLRAGPHQAVPGGSLGLGSLMGGVPTNGQEARAWRGDLTRAQRGEDRKAGLAASPGTVSSQRGPEPAGMRKGEWGCGPTSPDQ